MTGFMRKLAVPALLCAALCGCWFMSQPKAVVIVTDKARAKALITALQAQVQGLDAADVAVRTVGRNAPAEVLKALEWAAGKGIKTVGIDGDSYAPGDPVVGPRLKAMRDAGVYVAGMEFA